MTGRRVEGRRVSIHVHVVPERTIRERPYLDEGERRWCFVCRKHTTLTLSVKAPLDPMSYYGPRWEVRTDCCGTVDGDYFPGTWREWLDSGDAA